MPVGAGYYCDRVLAFGIRVDQRDARRIGDVLDRAGFYSGILQTIPQLNAERVIAKFSDNRDRASQTRSGYGLIRSFSAWEGAERRS